jgi:antitoxin VapB
LEIAKIFWSGQSQAVRLPRRYRFQAKEVRIWRRGSTVILEPIADNRQWLDAIVGKLDDDFIQAVNEQPAKSRSLRARKK